MASMASKFVGLDRVRAEGAECACLPYHSIVTACASLKEVKAAELARASSEQARCLDKTNLVEEIEGKGVDKSGTCKLIMPKQDVIMLDLALAALMYFLMGRMLSTALGRTKP